MALSIPSSPPAPGSLPAADTELSQEAVTGLNLEQQHADRDSGAPAARDLGLAAANGSAAAVPRCEAVALPAPKRDNLFPLQPSQCPLVPAQDMSWTGTGAAQRGPCLSLPSLLSRDTKVLQTQRNQQLPRRKCTFSSDSQWPQMKYFSCQCYVGRQIAVILSRTSTLQTCLWHTATLQPSQGVN